jgi:glycosyltransferase involved in cell wall biosynthesis
VVEAMTIGMPVVALATTELPNVITNGYNGFISCDVGELEEHMRHLLTEPAEALRLGHNARATARERFGRDRFIRDWNRAFERAIDLTESG